MSATLRLHLFSPGFDQALATINTALEPAGRCTVSISRRGFTVRVAGFLMVRNCPPEQLSERLKKAFAQASAGARPTA